MQDYHKVQAWQKAHPLAIDVRRAVNRLPRGYADLKSQLMRAADSIPSNIVEGCGASTRKEFARFLEISVKSAMELEYRCEVAAGSAAGVGAEWLSLAARTVEVRKMTVGYRKAILAADRRAEEECEDPPGRRATTADDDRPRGDGSPRR